jgi:hypothetical protein
VCPPILHFARFRPERDLIGAGFWAPSLANGTTSQSCLAAARSSRLWALASFEPCAPQILFPAMPAGSRLRPHRAFPGDFRHRRPPCDARRNRRVSGREAQFLPVGCCKAIAAERPRAGFAGHPYYSAIVNARLRVPRTCAPPLDLSASRASIPCRARSARSPIRIIFRGSPGATGPARAGSKIQTESQIGSNN